MTTSRPVAVALFERNLLFRELLSSALAVSGRYEVVASSTPTEFLLALASLPAAAVIDVEGVADPARLLHDAQEQSPGTRFLVLGEERSRDPVLGAYPTVSLLSANLAEVLAALPPVSAPRPEPHLSSRETEVLGLVTNGVANPAIAARLEITERTVKAHVSALYRKIGVENRVQLGLAGQALGLRVTAAEGLPPAPEG